MNWLALRLLRPYVITAAALSAASTLFILVGTHVIARLADARGIVVMDYAPDRTGLCEKDVSCLPTGAATNLTQAIVLIAAFAPLLIALILGVPLFAQEHQDATDAFVLTQSITRSRWLLTKLAWALTAGGICTAVVATAFRLSAARYALVADGPAALLREVHQNNIALMVTQTLFITVLAAVIGLATGRTLRTVAASVLLWPVALIVAQIGGLAVSMVLLALTSWSEPLSSIFGTQTETETASFAAVALAVGTVVGIVSSRRLVARSAPAS